MTRARQRLGSEAEDLVALRLGAAGWVMLERNARTRHGELDLVALDGGTLVFVEVKAGRAGSTSALSAQCSRSDRRSSGESAASPAPG